MQKYFDILAKCALFDGIDRESYNSMLQCLDAKVVNIDKKGYVCFEGDSAKYVGVLLGGKLQIVRDDCYGNRSVMAVINPTEIFAEVFACARLESMPVSVVAVVDSTVLLLDCYKIMSMCANACSYHNVLIQNLLQGMAQKILALNTKIRCMSQKTTKDKLLTYLYEQAKQQGNKQFTIPFDRQALADYLGVERSGLSVTISQLKQSGIIDSQGSWFCIKYYPTV